MTTRINHPAGGSSVPTSGSDGAPPRDQVVVESCTTTWAFDLTRSRFARLPRGLPLNSVSAEWRPYAHMTLDLAAGTLEVLLDAAGTRVLRSDVHTDAGCSTCGGDAGDGGGDGPDAA